jgi:glycosyltransferase involved in cell wall biosynthesis
MTGPPSTSSTHKAATPHISVCICTYKRPAYLTRLLTALFSQETAGRFSYSVAVVDNDHLASARAVVADLAAAAPISISYDVEPRQNIALARNKALEHAAGDFAALIDDDEEPSSDWLLRLLEALEAHDADGVLGPVLPRFESAPPDWALRGRCFERPSLPTGTVLRWRQTRTANVLLRRSVFDGPEGRFREEFGFGGEDVDFFRRQTAGGKRFVWCAEAKVHEAVPNERCSRRYLLKRALLRGRHPFNQGWLVLVSLAALPVYTLILPFLFITRHRLFMRYLISTCDHLGRVLAFAGGRLWEKVLPPGRA